MITRHVWQDCVERTDARRLTAQAKRIYQRRKEAVERSFTDAKQLHGHRYARYRGLRRVSGQCLLAQFFNPLGELIRLQMLWV